MSGIEYALENIRDDLKEFTDEMKGAIKAHKEKKRLTEEAKKEINRSLKTVDDARRRMISDVVSQIDERDRKLSDEFAKSIEKAQAELDRLELEYDDALKDIEETEVVAKTKIGEERQRLELQIKDMKDKADKLKSRINELHAEVEKNKEAMIHALDEVKDEFVTNHIILTQNIHDKAKSLIKTISKKKYLDPYCNFGFTAAQMTVDKIMSEEVSVAQYEVLNRRLDEVSKWVGELESRTLDGIRSAEIVRIISEKIFENMSKNPTVSKIVRSGNSTTEKHLVIHFPDCVSEISIVPDGNGGFNMSVNNITPGADGDTHKELCRNYTKLIAEAAELDYSAESIVDDGPVVVDFQKPVEKLEESKQELAKRVARHQ